LVCSPLTYPSRITKHLPDQTSRGVAKLGGAKSHFWPPAPYCDFSVFEYILLPAPLNCACSVKLLKKVILTIPRISRRERRTEKNYFAPPPAVPPTPTIWGKHRYVVRHISGHPPAKFGRRAGPGSARKTGSKFGEPPKNSPIFGGIAKKRYHRVAGAEPHHLRWSRRNRPPGASAARTRKTT
jgi:hypothetical protein